MGKVMAEAGHKTAMTITWKYAAGEEDVRAFKEGFGAAGGQVVGELWVPFPEVEFQSFLTQIAEKKPDGVFAFFAGGGAVKFVKDYAAAGLKKSVPLYGPGFLTDGTLQAQGEAAEGLKTTLHYADDLDNPADKKFRAEFAKRNGGAQPRRLCRAGLRRRGAARGRTRGGQGRHQGDGRDSTRRCGRPRSTRRAGRCRFPPRKIRCRTSICAK